MSEKSKLSALGQELEKSLIKILRDLDKEVKTENADGTTVMKPKYDLLDKMRVYDRALKLEAIKAKITDDEGSFFGQPGADE